MPAANPSTAGATPKEMMSASESNSRPSAECRRRQRATRPSSQSKRRAAGVMAVAAKIYIGNWLLMYSMLNNTDPSPLAALARVRKSAK